MRKYLSYLVLAIAFAFSFNVNAFTVDDGINGYSVISPAFDASEKVPIFDSASIDLVAGNSLNDETLKNTVLDPAMPKLVFVSAFKAKQFEVGWRIQSLKGY